MTSTLSNKSVDEKIDDHLARWRRLITSATPTNREMAEQGVNELYLLARGKKPDAIVWMDSPYQAAFIPVLVTNIIEGRQWENLTAQLRASGPVASPQWEACWVVCWERLRQTQVDGLANQFMSHKSLRSTKASVRAALLYRLERIMHDIAAEQKLRAGSFYTAEAKQKTFKAGRSYLPAPHGLNLAKRLVFLHGKVEQGAGLSLSLNFYTLVAPFVGAWDKRLVAKFVPGSEKYLGLKKPDPKVVVQLEKIRDKCLPQDTLSGTLFLWLLNMMAEPSHEPPLDIDPKASFFDTMKSQYNRALDSRPEPASSLPPNNQFICWLPYVAGWLAFALACRYVDSSLLGEVEPELECWAYMSHGAMGYVLCDNVCFVCPKPLKLVLNELDRPHNAEGSAARWQDGYEVYAWRGITIDGSWIEDKNSITSQAISLEHNVELRRVMLDIYGEARYLEEVGAKKIHEDECGILYSLEFKGDETLTMVKVRNSTPEPDGTYKDYFLRVPPNMVRAKQAVAWTFGLEESEYKPKQQS